jgi:hypothetical protein
MEPVPSVTLKGTVVDIDQRINFNIKLKSKSSLAMCRYTQSQINRSYSFYGNTNSSITKTFNYTFSLMDSLIETLSRLNDNYMNFIPDGMSIPTYIKVCDFEVNQIEIDFGSTDSTEGTFVVIRNSYYSDGDYETRHMVDLESGQTHTLNFPFRIIEEKQIFEFTLK